MTSKTILVAGTISSDYLVFPMTTQQVGLAAGQSGDDARVAVRNGGAELVSQLLTAVAPDYGFDILGPVAQSNGTRCISSNVSSIVDLDHQRKSPSNISTFEITRLKTVSYSTDWQAPVTSQAAKADPSTVVITGSGGNTRDEDSAIDLLQSIHPRTVILHMTRPLAVGKLWDYIRGAPKIGSTTFNADSLTVIVEADDLRAEGINLSQDLSWEATSEDFVRNLGSNGRLETLVTCANLIVRFGNQGVIHHRGRDASNPRLYFNPRQTECAPGLHSLPDMLGHCSAFTAGFTLGLAHGPQPEIEKGIRLGISAARAFTEIGFVQDPHDRTPNYPIKQVMESLKPDVHFTHASIPSGKISSGEKWSLFDGLTGDPAEVARQVATLGPERALTRCPMQRFGKLYSIDRSEQERLGAVVDIIEERLCARETTPTCVGIFGPAGSGKKFASHSLADHLSKDRNVKKLVFDGRSLRDEHFAAACHTIRDASAVGSIPVVLFQNFGNLLEIESPIVNSFLTLMNEGIFIDNGNERRLGHAVLFFLLDQDHVDNDAAQTPVATEFSLRRRATTFSAPEMKDPRSEDSPLMDSLHGIVTVAGPNSISKEDRIFPVRRALMLRELIKRKHPHMEINGVINFDDAVLHALLLTPYFKHGLHSLEKIISTSKLAHRTKFEVAALPPEEQIQLHADGKIFMSYLRSPRLPPALRERLAQGLFEAYKKQRVAMAKSDAEREELESDRSFCDWDDLPGELKESTRAQADDIPRKLRATGCFMLNDGSEEPRGEPLVQVPKFGEQELLMLGELEHERFNAERLQRQWRMGPRSSKQRTTPFLVPWRDLTMEWKLVDMVMVECVPGILETAGWRIYRYDTPS